MDIVRDDEHLFVYGHCASGSLFEDNSRNYCQLGVVSG